MTFSQRNVRELRGLDWRFGQDGNRADSPLDREVQTSTDGPEIWGEVNAIPEQVAGAEDETFSPLIRPVCFANAYGEDESGLSFPGGLASVVTERRRGRLWQALALSTPVTYHLSGRRYIRGLQYRAFNIPPGSTVAVKLAHTSDWHISGVPADYTVFATYRLDGADGVDQVIAIDDITAGAGYKVWSTDPYMDIRIEVTWTGSLPASHALSALLAVTAVPAFDAPDDGKGGSFYGWNEFLCPTSLPGGYTANLKAEVDRGGYPGAALGVGYMRRGARCNTSIADAGRFCSDASQFYNQGVLVGEETGPAGVYRPACCNGQAHIPSWPEFVCTQLQFPIWPCVFVDGVLKKHPLRPYARGPFCFTSGPRESNNTLFYPTTDVVGETIFLACGAGWRNVRVFLSQQPWIGSDPVASVTAKVMRTDNWDCQISSYFTTDSSIPAGMDHEDAWYQPVLDSCAEVDRIWTIGTNPGGDSGPPCFAPNVSGYWVFPTGDDTLLSTATHVAAAASASGISVDEKNPTVLDLGAVAPPDGNAVGTIYLRLDITANNPDPPGLVSFIVYYNFMASPRVDIPPLFSTYGDGLTVPGGYRDDLLEDTSNPVPPDHQAAGVTVKTYAGPTFGNGYLTSFLPPTDGLWDVIVTGMDSALGGCLGSDEFGREYRFGADLEFAGRRVYAWGQASSSDLVFTLTEVAAPTKAIASGGTTFAPSDVTVLGRQVSRWLFGTIAFPAAGTYEISVLYTYASGGLGITLCGHPSSALVMSPAFEVSYGPDWEFSFPAEQTAPPAVTPGGRTPYIVLPTATGLWAGQEGTIAMWESLLGRWRFITPRHGYIGLINFTTLRWHDGTAWKGPSDPVIKQRVTVDAAGTYYIRIGSCAPRRELTSITPFPSGTISWAAV